MPEVEVHWYDGGMMPNRPEGFPEGKELMGPGGGLTIFHGTKDTLVCGCYGQQPFLLSGRVPNAPKVCRRVKNHEMDWVRACKESASNRVQTKSNFLEAGPFNEMIVMGYGGASTHKVAPTLNGTATTCSSPTSAITK